jgi:spermidine synthase
LADETPEGADTSQRYVEDVGRYDFFVRTFPTHTQVFSLFGPKPGIRSARSELAIAQGRRRASVSFDGPVHIPILGTKSGSVWMSLTPNEIFTQRAGLRKAKGRVLIAGLGMGWLTREVLAKKSVKRVTQVELVPEVISFFGDPLLEASDKLEIVQGDVWDLLSTDIDVNQYDTILFDIWAGYGEAYWDSEFRKLKRSHPRVWGWGDFEPK